MYLAVWTRSRLIPPPHSPPLMDSVPFTHSTSILQYASLRANGKSLASACNDLVSTHIFPLYTYTVALILVVSTPHCYHDPPLIPRVLDHHLTSRQTKLTEEANKDLNRPD